MASCNVIKKDCRVFTTSCSQPFKFSVWVEIFHSYAFFKNDDLLFGPRFKILGIFLAGK